MMSNRRNAAAIVRLSGKQKPVNSYVYRFFYWTIQFQTPRVGLEPTTPRLTAACSTIELSRTIPSPHMPSKTHTETEHHLHTPSFFPWSSPRPISGSQLHALLHSHPCPINLIVSKGSYSFRMGHPILGGASRLDAFSAYPFRAWLPCHGIGMPTGTPVARPSRSSRTGDSPPQMSCARAG